MIKHRSDVEGISADKRLGEPLTDVVERAVKYYLCPRPARSIPYTTAVYHIFREVYHILHSAFRSFSAPVYYDISQR